MTFTLSHYILQPNISTNSGITLAQNIEKWGYGQAA